MEIEARNATYRARAMDLRRERARTYPCCCCLLAVGMLLMIILLPLSFSGIEYYEAGLKSQRSTSKINRNRVYTSGRHNIGPDYEFKTFVITAQSLEFIGLNVWTKNDGDVSAGTSVDIDVSIQYRLRAHDIGKLYGIVGLNYEPLVRTRTIEAVKDTAPLFTLAEFLTTRQQIEMAMAKNVSLSLDGVYTDLLALQLRKINFPSEVRTQKLAAAIQDEVNDKELYLQQASVIRSQTTVAVRAVDNQAVLVTQSANAEAALIVDKGNFQALQIVEDARNDGLEKLYKALNITSQAHKASLDYIMTLASKAQDGQVKSWVDFSGANVLAQP